MPAGRRGHEWKRPTSGQPSAEPSGQTAPIAPRDPCSRSCTLRSGCWGGAAGGGRPATPAGRSLTRPFARPQAPEAQRHRQYTPGNRSRESGMLIRGPRHVRARGLGDRPEGESAPRITGETPLPALLDDLLDAVSVGIVVQRPDGEPLWVNTAARALLGPDPVEALSSAAAGAMRRGRLQQTVLDLGPHQRPEGAHRGPDDEPSEVLVTTVPIAPYGGPVAALVSTVSAEADRPADA